MTTATVVEGLHYRTLEPIAVHVQGTRIVGVQTLPPARRRELPLVGPGLVDLQLNGAFGLDFNAPMADGLMRDVVGKLYAEGVTTVLPTIFSHTDEFIRDRLAEVAGACEQDEAVNAAVAGIHLEGPFIAPEDGPRGAHNPVFVKAPDWDVLQRWNDASGGRIKIVTLAPEWPGSGGFIARCVQNGIAASIGHTAANTAQIREAVAAGATMSTHLGNGAHLALPRHPNYLWDQLAEDALWAGFIGDGFHLPDAVLRVIVRMKGERAFLVSDAVYISGMPPGPYDTIDGVGAVLDPSGRLHTRDDPELLYGSAQLLPRHIEHLVRQGICSPADAWELASVRAARSIGLPCGAGLSAGAPADLALFEWEAGRIRVLATVKSGNKVYACDGQRDAACLKSLIREIH